MMETFEFLSASIRDLYFPIFLSMVIIAAQKNWKFNLLRTITYSWYSGIDCNLRKLYGEAALSDVLHLISCPD